LDKRTLLQTLAAASVAAIMPPAAGATTPAEDAEPTGPMPVLEPLHAPADADIPVAFLLSDTAVVIDFAGPWEVFQDVVVSGRANPNPFRTYTVAETMRPIKASGGLTILPNYTLATAPPPKVVVIPAQDDSSPAVLAWIRQTAPHADMVMSVCTGAFLLAKTGLLAGKPATTHHGAYAELAMDHPDIAVQRGARFVDNGSVASSGGLSSGIDLALHIVARYFGRAIAANTADTMEYQGTGWMNPGSNAAHAKRRVSSREHPCCAVCEMDVDARTAPASDYHGKHYLFCGLPHQALFVAHPDRFAIG